MDKNLLQALQDQLTLERNNAAYYDALSASLAAWYWPGSSLWMKRAANDEREHADKMSGHIVDRGAVPLFVALENIPLIANDELTAYFTAALNREKLTTEAIKTLYYMAESAEDPQLCVFLHWFIQEQTDSERDIVDILTMLARLDNNGRVVFDATLK